MQILFWGTEESFDKLYEDCLSKDELIEKCTLPEMIKKKSEEVPEHACVLILDGDYEYMFHVCMEQGYNRARIIDYSRYLLYKELESMIEEKNLNGKEATELWYTVLQKVIAAYDQNGEVIGACKLFFERKLFCMSFEEFWNSGYTYT